MNTAPAPRNGNNANRRCCSRRDALTAEHLTVTEDVYCQEGFIVIGTVRLSNARVGVLWDDPGLWPRHLYLDGLVYDDLQPQLPAKKRLEWLDRCGGGYYPQPYEQLAAYYRRIGHDSEARQVLVAKHSRRRRILSWPRKIGNLALQAVVGYGYRPGRAAVWMLASLAAGSTFFAIHQPAPLKPGEQPHYQPALYTADLLLPVISLGQDRA